LNQSKGQGFTICEVTTNWLNYWGTSINMK